MRWYGFWNELSGLLRDVLHADPEYVRLVQFQTEKEYSVAIMDVVKWDVFDPRRIAGAGQAPQSVHQFAYKHPSQELATWSQLIVAESQEAVLVKGGEMIGPFGAGRHVLDTENIPALGQLVKIPFGSRSPFTAEVWFVNKMIPLDIKWGTPDPIQLQDPKYNIMLPVRAHGQYAVQVIQTKKFLTKLVGTLGGFDSGQIQSYFRGVILTTAKDSISRYIVRDGVSVLEISSRLAEISDALKASMEQELDEFGLSLVKFYVHSINTPEDDPAVQQLKTALSKRAEMNILGYTYQQERSFDTLEAAASNSSGAQSELLGAGIGLGMGVGIGGGVGQSMQTVSRQMDVDTDRIPCSKCRADNPQGAKFCAGCGSSLVSASVSCWRCGSEVGDGAKFCGECGTPQQRNCANCDAALERSAKFCMECGTPATEDKG